MTDAELRTAMGWDKPIVKQTDEDRIQELADWERRLRRLLEETIGRRRHLPGGDMNGQENLGALQSRAYAAGRHGTEHSYRRKGCRCVECCKAHEVTLAEARARKETYRGICATCGKKTNGANGPGSASDECVDCLHQRQHDERHWMPEEIVAEIRKWTDEHGRKPFATDWLVAGAPVSVRTVQREFGSWNAALAAAGLPTERPGTFARSPETLARMSESQKRRFGVRGEYGDLVRLPPLFIGERQLAGLNALGGNRAEHLRKAIDMYLTCADASGSSLQDSKPAGVCLLEETHDGRISVASKVGRSGGGA